MEEEGMNEAGRATGRTTRLTDRYIQELFELYRDDRSGFVRVVDHFPTREADRVLIGKIRDRLRREHNLECEFRQPNWLRIKKN